MPSYISTGNKINRISGLAVRQFLHYKKKVNRIRLMRNQPHPKTKRDTPKLADTSCHKTKVEQA